MPWRMRPALDSGSLPVAVKKPGPNRVDQLTYGFGVGAIEECS